MHRLKKFWFYCNGFRQRLAVALSLMVLAAVAGTAHAAAPSAPPAGAPAVLLVVGDSLSAEYGIASGQGWVNLLAQKFQQEGTAVRVVNASISGETTAGGRSRMAALLQQHQPRYVAIELGANDALRGLPLEGTRTNLRAMVQAAKNAGARVLLLGIQVPPNYGQRYTEEFAQGFVSVAEQESVPLVPFLLEAISDPAQLERYFQSDRIHPNALAQPLILQTVWPAVRALVQQP